MRKIAVAVCLLALLFGACGNDDDPSIEATDEPTAINVTTKDYAFAPAPTTVNVDRLATLTVTNEGTEGHEAALIKLADGKTLDDVRAALSPTAPPGPPPFTLAGGTTGTDPGTSTSVTQALPAGQYAFICFIPAQDGTPHFAKGMLAPLTVTGNSTSSLPLPDGVNATGTEFAFELPKLEAGTTTIRFKNAGQQDHVLGLARVADGKTAEDALAWFKAPTGPPPLKFMGGPAAGPGGSNSFEATLTKGTYVFYCPMPDVTQPRPQPEHVTKGMFAGVTIT